MGSFYGMKIVKREGKVDKIEDDVKPLVVSAVVTPSHIALPLASAEQPSESGKVNVKDALGSKLSVLGSMFGGSQISLDKNIHDMNTVDEHLSMKTEIHDVATAAMWAMVGELALERGYPRTAAVFKRYTLHSEAKAVSNERKGRREQERIYTARLGVEDAGVNEDDSMKDKMIGKRVSR